MTTAPPRSVLLAGPGPAGQAGTQIARFQGLYAALRAGDLSSVLSRLAPGLEWEEDRGEPGRPIRRRHVGRGPVARLLLEPWGRPRALEIVHLVESGSTVAVLAADDPEPNGTAPVHLEAHLWTLDPRGFVTHFRQVAGRSRPTVVH